MSEKNQVLAPLLERSRSRLETTRGRFEVQAKRYRMLAESAHPEFKQRYLELAESIDLYLRSLPAPLEEAE